MSGAHVLTYLHFNSIPRATSPMPPPPPPISNECKELVTCETFGPEYDEEDSSTVSTTKESIRGIEDSKAPKRPASSYGK